MKNWALLTYLLLAAMMPCAAQNNFYVSDPQRWSGQVQGNIDSAVLEIRPAGAYIEFGLELNISTQGTYYNSISDTVEAVLNFTLPKGSIMHDSWLWVGNDIMQGLLMERGEATDIYEGIVNRRKDPSLLFKNSETSYQLRVFPVAGHEPRKLKLTYLVPAKFSIAQMMAALPLELLKTSRTVPSLILVVNTNPTFINPEVVGNLSLPLVGPDADGRYITILSAAQVQSSTLINMAYDSPIQNGMFMAYYPYTPQSGYYQLVVNQQQLTAGNRPPKKLALVLHHEPNRSTMGVQEMVYWCGKFLSNHLAANDSFNIIFSNNGNVYYSTTWMAASTAHISSAIQDVAARIAIPGSHTWAQKVVFAADFVKLKGGDGNIVLVTNHRTNYNNAQINSQISSLNTAMAGYQGAVHVVNYTESYIYSSTNSLFNGVAHSTHGTYRNLGYQYYFDYNTYEDVHINGGTLLDALGELSAELDNTHIQAYDIYPTLSPGITYDKYYLDAVYGFNSNTVVQVGRYYGSLPIDVNYNAFTTGGLVTHNWQITQPYDTDSFSRKIWGGVHISTLEGNSSSAAMYQTIVDTSLAYRVLSRNTAFLCLEPNDTLSACEGCEAINDDFVQVNVADLVTDTLLGLALSAQPNPFSGNLTIEVQLPKGSSTINITIVDLLGRVVYQTEIIPQPGTTTHTLVWDGLGADGGNLPAGIYILNATDGNQVQSLKLVKAQ